LRNGRKPFLISLQSAAISGKGKSTMKSIFLHPAAILILLIVLAGCGNAAPPTTPAATETEVEATSAVSTSSTLESTSTPDPCSRPQLNTEVQEVHKHMREFDDASILASNMPREQLSNSIADLQRIRREAEDEEIPGCLTNLKAIQVQHMNSVITTLIAFMGGTDQQTLDQGIALARQQHDEYTLELARVLGLTVVPAPQPSLPSETPIP
jgi:predicted small lipoprotein YifL